MTSSAQVFSDLAKAKPAGTPGESKDQHPKLPPNGKFLLRVTHCELVEGPDCGDCMVIEHQVVESDVPAAMPGQVFTTTITHLTGEYRDLKQGKVKNFLAAVFGHDESDSSQPWPEIAVYVNDKDAAAGRLVRAETGSVRKSKGKGRPYLHVQFSPA